MSHAVTVRLPEHLAEWLDDTASKTGLSRDKIIRDQAEKARSMEERPFLALGR